MRETAWPFVLRNVRLGLSTKLTAHRANLANGPQNLAFARVTTRTHSVHHPYIRSAPFWWFNGANDKALQELVNARRCTGFVALALGRQPREAVGDFLRNRLGIDAGALGRHTQAKQIGLIPSRQCDGIVVCRNLTSLLSLLKDV